MSLDHERLPADLGAAPGNTRVRRPVVIYIAGDGRSGSTLLSQLLGQAAGWFSVGEARFVWERGLLGNRLCECGVPFRDCAYWGRVIEEGFGCADAIPLPEIVAADSRLLRTRHSLRAWRATADPDRWTSGVDSYVRSTANLYRAMQRVAGAQVLVDSSKLPAYGMLLRATGQVRLFVVHMVRDPRAVAHSWRRWKPLHEPGPAAYMERRSLARSCAVWNATNALAELLLRDAEGFVRARYEDLVADPRATVSQVLASLGLDATVPDLDPGAQLRPGHAAAGNPSRHDRGALHLRLDDAWRTEMSRRDVTAVTALTSPLMRRYGYL